MKKEKKYILKYIIVAAFLIAIIGIPIFITFAEEKAVDMASITAVLYDTSAYDEGTGVEITEEGTTISAWKYSVTKYLQIDPSVPADGNTYKVLVEMPQEFYAAIGEVSKPTGYQNVEFTKNESFIVNTNQTYPLKTYSGSFEYTMAEGQSTGTIQIPISFDDVLWSNVEGASLTPEGVSPVVIKLKKVDSNGNEEIIKELSISKAYAGVARGFSSYMDILNSDGSVVSTLTTDKQFFVSPRYLNSNQESLKRYYPKIVAQIKMPSYKDANGVIHYAVPDIDNINYEVFEKVKKTVDNSTLSENGIFTITFEDAWFSSARFPVIPISFPDSLKDSEETSFKFTGGSFKYIADAKNGDKDITFYSRTIDAVTYTNQLEEKVSPYNLSTNVTQTEKSGEIVNLLGGLTLVNSGTGDSGKKNINIEFDTENTGKIKVTTVNILADTLQEYINIKYTMVDENGERVYLDTDGNRVEETDEGAIGEWDYKQKNSYYNKTTINNLNNRLTRKNLPENMQQYYFKTVKYSLQTIKSGTKLYSISSQKATGSAGNFFGYLSSDAISGNKIISKMIVVSENSNISDLETTTSTIITNVNAPSYYLSGVTMSANSIMAGSSVNLQGKISVTQYPYGYINWLKQIIMGVVLPKGVTINERAINIKYASTGEEISNIEVLEPQELEDDNYLWRIKLPEDSCIGYYTENLGAISNGSTITFSIQLDTAITMNTTNLVTNDMVYVAGYKQLNNANGAYNWARRVDIYDLNENGLTNDIVAGIQSTTSVTCQITPQTAALDVSENISINSNGTILPTGSESIYSKDDIVTYNLNIGCTSGGQVDEFAYYIPIPKKSASTDKFLVKNDVESRFDFQLQENAVIEGNDIINIEYAFEKGLYYTKVKTLETWYTEEQILNDDSLKLEDVTMLKLTMKNGIISNGDSCKISLNLKYAGDYYIKETGFINQWSSCGYYSYLNNGRVLSGDFPTDGVSVNIKANIENIESRDITLTAAKEMTPLEDGNINIYTNKDLGSFLKNHTIIIKNIETYNVNLQTKEYMLNNIDMAGVNANTNFAITVALNNGVECNIIPGNNITVGTAEANNNIDFTYKLYNADALSDNLKTRYIIVTFESDNGLEIKQKININVEANLAVEVVPTIVAGKSYTPVADVQSTITICKDGSFTAQITPSYIPEIYTAQQLVYKNPLPQETTITLINKRENSNPTFWYYKIEEDNISIVDLSKFKKMGTTSGNLYNYPTGQDLIDEQFTIITDFSRCNTYLENGNNTIQMIFTGNNVSDFKSTSLEFIISDKREFNLETSQENTNIGEEVKITYEISEITGIDTINFGKKLAMVITASQNSPLDAHIVVNNNKYYMNSQNEFIIPLKDVEVGTNEITFKLETNTLPKDELEYTLDIALWVSQTANGNAPKKGREVIKKVIKQVKVKEELPSLKVEKIEKRIIETSELKNENTITINYIKPENNTLTLELWQKVGNGYQKVTNRLNEVNGITQHEMGVFKVEANLGENDIKIMLASSTEKGTYRLIFKCLDETGNVMREIPYNFIVI